ncbi:amino acid permease [Qipengyuania sp. JC766]|uniref:APC family permease n=1 Tax=Qipengyuania sp. JC766 TaxID=3232139 RepID=UPI003459FFD9
MGLKRSMGLASLTFYGTGTILGAGIFVVIGEVIGEAGTLAPIAYLAAALVAFTTALTFAELGARIPDAGGAMEYAARAFGEGFLASASGWLLIVANLVSAATIVTGFVSYLDSFVSIEGQIATTVLVLLLGAVATVGIKQSAWFMTVTTLVGIGTLLFVLWVTRADMIAAPAAIANADSWGAGSATAILAGAFLAVYSFIGFGDMGQTAEEVRDVERTLPRAIVFSLLIVFVFYLAVSAALVGGNATEAISDAQAPLVEAVVRKGWPAMPVAIASLFVIVNGALAQMIASSRMMMDMARDGRSVMPLAMERVNERTNTPVLATLVCAGIVLALALFLPLKTLASGTSLAILLVFVIANAALHRLKKQDQPEGVPNVWRIVPVLGMIFCALALVGQVVLWVTGIGSAGH